MNAWLVLWLWPVISVGLFQSLKLPVALSVAFIGGYLLLPSGLAWELRGLPSINRMSIVAVATLLLTLITLVSIPDKRQFLTNFLPRNLVMFTCLAGLVIAEFGTVATNRDTLVFGFRVIPGLTWRDAFSGLVTLCLILVPFFLGRMILCTREAQKTLLIVVVGFAMFYSVLALYEVRMAPQLHRQIYGYAPFSFVQQMRSGGFRPVVFLNHGLAVSIFLTLSLLAAATLFRVTAGPARWKWAAAAVWLFGVLVLSKSLGALMIATILLPCVLFLNSRLQMVVAVCMACIFISYPVLRSAGLIPVEQIRSFVEQIDIGRAQSFNVRIVNEDRLLERAFEKPWFGWGGWGRARVYSEEGFDLSITDGSWVIAFGDGGWINYFSFFGLMSWPIWGFFLRRREKIDPITAGLALMLCAKLVDLIPNSGFDSIYWLMVGSLAGRLEMSARGVGQGNADTTSGGQQTVPGPARSLGYARDFSKTENLRPARKVENTNSEPREKHSYNRTLDITRHRK